SNRRRFAPVGGTQLTVDVGDMKLRGARADEEPAGDLGVAEAFSQQAEHLLLATSEGLDQDRLVAARCHDWRRAIVGERVAIGRYLPEEGARRCQGLPPRQGGAF